jgi:hypothetical protein
LLYAGRLQIKRQRNRRLAIDTALNKDMNGRDRPGHDD